MFRPSIETLEKREVFSAMPVVMPQHDGSSKETGFASGQHPDAAQVGSDHAWGTMMVTGDFNNDGRFDVAIKSPRDPASGDATQLTDVAANAPYTYPNWLPGTLIDHYDGGAGFDTGVVARSGFHLLPFVEQDNVYRFADTVFDDNAFLSALYQDVLGRAVDAGSEAAPQDQALNDSLLPPDATREQIIAILIGLLDRPVDAQGASRFADVTDGTSNTLMLGRQIVADPSDPSGNTTYRSPNIAHAAVTDLVIDPFNSTRLQDSRPPHGVLIGLLVP